MLAPFRPSELRSRVGRHGHGTDGATPQPGEPADAAHGGLAQTSLVSSTDPTASVDFRPGTSPSGRVSASTPLGILSGVSVGTATPPPRSGTRSAGRSTRRLRDADRSSQATPSSLSTLPAGAERTSPTPATIRELSTRLSERQPTGLLARLSSRTSPDRSASSSAATSRTPTPLWRSMLYEERSTAFSPALDSLARTLLLSRPNTAPAATSPRADDAARPSRSPSPTRTPGWALYSTIRRHTRSPGPTHYPVLRPTRLPAQFAREDRLRHLARADRGHDSPGPLAHATVGVPVTALRSPRFAPPVALRVTSAWCYASPFRGKSGQSWLPCI